MRFIKGVLHPRNIASDVRTTVISMIVVGILGVLGSVAGAVWKALQKQPVQEWGLVIILFIAGCSVIAFALLRLRSASFTLPFEHAVIPFVHNRKMVSLLVFVATGAVLGSTLGFVAWLFYNQPVKTPSLVVETKPQPISTPEFVLSITGVVFQDTFDHRAAIIKVILEIFNKGTPSTAHDWSLTANVLGNSHDTVYLSVDESGPPPAGAPVTKRLDEMLSTDALGTNMQKFGAVRFLINGLTYEELGEAAKKQGAPFTIKLSVQDNRNKKWDSADTDMHKLAEQYSLTIKPSPSPTLAANLPTISPAPSVTLQPEKERDTVVAARQAAERWRSTSTIPQEEEARQQVRQAYQKICDNIADKFSQYSPKKSWEPHQVRTVVSSTWFEPGLGPSEVFPNSICSGVRVEVHYRATEAIEFNYRSVILIGKTAKGSEAIAFTTDTEKKNDVVWSILSEGGSPSDNDTLIIKTINQEVDRLNTKITQDIQALPH